MTSNARPGGRILGSLRSADGKGVVRMEDRFDTDIDDLWSALTDPRRLARWLGEVEGDLRLGGEFRARFFASGWEGTGAWKRASRRGGCWCDQGHGPGSTRMSSRSCWPPTATRPSWSSRNAACPWTCSPSTGPGCRSMSKISPPTSPVVSAATTDVRWDELVPPYKDLAANVG